MDEYIKRKTALAWLAEGGYWEREDLEVAQYIVGSVPAADVEEVRHGKWVEWRTNIAAICLTGETVLYACSKCTAKYTSVSNYCPYCGAKMDGGADNE